MSNKLSGSLPNERESFVTCRNSQGVEMRGTPVRLTRFTVVMEVYNPYSILQLSEVLSEFRITMNDRVVYAGRAVVSNLVNTGIMVLCEATLEESWLDVDLFSPISQPQRLRDEFETFMTEWRKTRSVIPEFKVAVADFQTLLMDLRRWLEQVELGVRSEPVGARTAMERDVLQELEGRILPEIGEWMDRFDLVADQVNDEVRPAHRAYARRQLHPLVLCAPFVYRTFHKPLGYAGDYEMVNMILRDAHEGATMFAKIVNVCFLQNPPAQAHRNRIVHLKKRLAEETRRVAATGRRARILNLGCGPAREIQQFIAEDPISSEADFVLLDFNPQTLEFARQNLVETRQKYGRSTGIELRERSVHELLRDAVRGGPTKAEERFDFVYCAGLFDYVSDRVCKLLVDTFYEQASSGALVLVTNVNAARPFRHSMDYLLEWHLIYRNETHLGKLIPVLKPAPQWQVLADPTGVNLFLEIRKP